MSKYKQTLLFRLNARGKKAINSTAQHEFKRKKQRTSGRQSEQNLRANLKAFAVQQCRASIILTAYRNKSVNVNAEKRMAAKRDLHFKIYRTAVAGVS